MDNQLLKALLHNDFYLSNKSNLSRQLFEDEHQDLYDVIVEAQEKFAHDLNTYELHALWLKSNPVATRSEKDAIRAIIEELDDTPDMSDDVATDVLRDLWKRFIGQKIANLGIEITEGNDTAMERLDKLLERTKDGFLPDDFGEPTTTDIEELLAFTSDDARWQFNIETLSRQVYGIGPGEFGVVFALPETGKSAFVVSVCAGPGGFCEQGAKVLYLGNEEKTSRTMLRAMQAWSGMTKEAIIKDPRSARNKFKAIEDRLIMNDVQDWDLTKIEAYISVQKPDVLIIDQGDKVHISGNYSASHERLRELYRSLREVAKRYNCALLTVSQASADAKGRTRLSPFDMEGSKIGKAAETDLIIGIGKHEAGDVDDSEPDTTRYLTVSKNKLSGWHGTIICNIQPEISRYVA
jgi:replicative DNA helicase